ncbi:MAG: hypothetical protein BMS9Abin04_184 [Planctomycetia bacterium]|nr:MAG: hypothetical protein BMS9Abin04_184 [Planctomycetia bacterium]
MHKPRNIVSAFALIAVVCQASAAGARPASTIPDDFPRFTVPGREREMQALRELYWLHYQPAGPLATLWDEWISGPTLWPALESNGAMKTIRQRWRTALSARIIDPEGYVATHQHPSIAHQLGWPFPFWRQSPGGTWGWHFSLQNVMAGWHGTTERTQEGWTLVGAEDQGIADHAWNIRLTRPRAMVLPPPLEFDAYQAPFMFTFLNLEAVHYGFATEEQARDIMSWITARRIVAGDTSQGSDIYRWRFAPRSTTKRNVDYYGWFWSSPESIPWGRQVQDGGAVLGFAYHDLMARLQKLGPDNAWARLAEILAWFDEVQEAGGYRAYYKDGKHGNTLQGAGTPGGLGLDKEFFESILVPQVMLDGFLGFKAKPDGFALAPSLPADWSELGIDRIHWDNLILSVRATRSAMTIEKQGEPADAMRLYLPAGSWKPNTGTPKAVRCTNRTRRSVRRAKGLTSIGTARLRSGSRTDIALAFSRTPAGTSLRGNRPPGSAPAARPARGGCPWGRASASAALPGSAFPSSDRSPLPSCPWPRRAG